MSVFSAIIARHGMPSVIHEGTAERTVRAFFEPASSAVRGGEENAVTRLGEVSASRWYWFGPPDSGLYDPEHTYITVCGGDYDVLKAEPYYLGGGVSHWEALLKRREEAFDG